MAVSGLLMAFAVKLFPQPGIPNNKIPLGSGKPKSRAAGLKAFPRFVNQRFSSSNPPTSFMFSLA